MIQWNGLLGVEIVLETSHLDSRLAILGQLLNHEVIRVEALGQPVVAKLATSFAVGLGWLGVRHERELDLFSPAFLLLLLSRLLLHQL